MSKTTRYGRKGGDLEPLKNGQYVTYSDYAALQAENERLRKLQNETAQDAYSWRELYQMLKARWEAAAKEGRDAK